ncbi:MAG: carboxypeptidase regulatory-like domain-containing protein [Planctomycetes bacterium]|nr:carboxypeptidase regulatory-like domain-containing protein [Planctomycetota bacterium]
MKRVLLPLAVLTALATLIWLVASRATPVPGTPPAPAASPPAPASARPNAAALEGEPAPATARVREPTSSVARAETPIPHSVRGQVVFARTHAIVPNGDVELSYSLAQPEAEAGASAERGERRRYERSTLDAEGRFAFDLPLGSHLTQVNVKPELSHFDPSDPRTGTMAAFGARELPLEDEVTEAGVDLVVEVLGPATLRGLVLDSQSRAPLAGARIRANELPGYHTDEFTGPDGSFVLEGLLPWPEHTKMRLRVDAPDHLACSLDLPGERLGDAAPLVIELPRGLTIAGRIVDARGLPVAGVTLRWRAVGLDPALDISASANSMHSDVHGEFRFSPVPPCNGLALEIERQQRNGIDLLARRRELGPLREDRTDLEVVVLGAALLEVRATLADGTALAPGQLQFLCTNHAGVEVAHRSRDSVQLRVPAGVELELEAYARAREASRPGAEDPRVFLRGRARTRVEPGDGGRPLVMVLSERSILDAPPEREGVRVFTLGDPGLLPSTVDVQLLDSLTGAPIESGKRIAISCSGASILSSSLEAGWLRVVGAPGTHVFEVELDGGAHETQELVLPVSGYAKAQWRLGGVR